MHTRFSWIYFSLLLQQAFGASSSTPSVQEPLSITLAAAHPTPPSVVGENIDRVLPKFTQSLSPSQSPQLEESLRAMLQRYDAQIDSLSSTLGEYEEAAKRAIDVLDHLSTALNACQTENSLPSSSQSTNFLGPKTERIYNQLYRSYITLKPEFQGALRLLQKNFPGFKYDRKKLAGLEEQFENWEKSNTTTAPVATAKK